MLPNLRFFSEHVNYFENSKLHGSFKGVKGNLKKTRSAWDSLLESIHSDQVKADRQENIVRLNRKYLACYSCSSIVIYSEASDIAAGACTVELKSKFFIQCGTRLKKFRVQPGVR